MSESTVRGRITNFSPKPDKNYYGLEVDTDEHGKQWYNGSGNPENSWKKGDLVKLKINKNEFIDIQEIIFPEKSGASEDGATRDSSGDADADQHSSVGGSTADSAYISKQERIMLQTAFKKAVDTMIEEEKAIDDNLNQGEKLEVVGEYTNGYYNLMKAQLEDKGGDDQ